MIYLLAKYTLLFLLAALLGFVLGYWFARRNFEDVSESFEDLRKANARSDARQWDRLFSFLDALPEPKETNLSGVYERIDGVSNAVAALPQPTPANFAPIETRLNGISERIKSIPLPIRPDPVDLGPVTRQLETIEHRVNDLSRPQSVNLAPFDSRLQAIEVELAKLGRRLEQPRVEEPTSPREPRILKAALYGAKDNLQAISGVGPKLEKLLNSNGVFYYWQVASWSDDDIETIDERLDTFKGRIARDDWVNQAQQLRTQPDAAQVPTDIKTQE